MSRLNDKFFVFCENTEAFLPKNNLTAILLKKKSSWNTVIFLIKTSLIIIVL